VRKHADANRFVTHPVIWDYDEARIGHMTRAAQDNSDASGWRRTGEAQASIATKEQYDESHEQAEIGRAR
jgi:hypothetical protein